MIDVHILKDMFRRLAAAMVENKELLTDLDSATGDGDLGISMEQGFGAVSGFLESCEETDVGKLLMRCAMTLNEASPSTLGTILSVGMMAGGKALKGKTVCGVDELAEFFATGNAAIMERSKSKPGEKTVLDALAPAQKALEKAAAQAASVAAAMSDAARAAAQGCEATKAMTAVHGRAAYYAEKSIGRQDGGATVAKILFETLAAALSGNSGKEDQN